MSLRRWARSTVRSAGGIAQALTVVALVTVGVTAIVASDAFAGFLQLEQEGFEAPDRLFVAWTTNVERGWGYSSSSAPDYLDLRRATRLSALAATSPASVTVTEGSRPERVRAALASFNLLDVLGVPIVAGRTFVSSEDETRPSPPVAVVSRGFARRWWGSAGDAVGRRLTVDGVVREVVGVYAGFRFDGVPLDLMFTEDLTRYEPRARRSLIVVGRRLAADRQAVAEELGSLVERLAAAYPENRGNGVAVEALADAWYRGPFRDAARLGTIGVVAVVLATWINLTALLSAASLARRHESRIRVALGATRYRLLRHGLVDTLPLAAAGVLCGVVLGRMTVFGFRFLAPDPLSFVDPTTGPGLVVAVTAGALVAVALGTAPLAVRSGLPRASRTAAGTSRALQVIQVSVSFTMVFFVLVFARLVHDLRTVDVGFDPVGVSSLRVASDHDILDPVTSRAIVERMRAVAGVDAVATVSRPPLGGHSTIGYRVDDDDVGERRDVGYRLASPEYAVVMRLRLAAGRWFARSDGPGTTAVAVVNRRFAETHWPEVPPVGQRVIVSQRAVVVIGVVENVRVLGPRRGAPPLIYLAAAQHEPHDRAYVIRASGLPPNDLLNTVREAVADIVPGVPVYDVTVLAAAIADDLRRIRIVPWGLGVLAVAVIALAFAGVQATTSRAVRRRTSEIAVRMALGTTWLRLWAVVGRGVGSTVLAGLVGGAVMTAIARPRVAYLYESVVAWEPMAVWLSGLGIVLVVMGAAVPAVVEAASVSPARAMRAETRLGV